MRIACLAWGSLIWKSAPLVTVSPWQTGGPLLPIEFARVCDEAELATVICDGTPPVPTRWALLDAGDLVTARELLRQREKIDVAQPEFVGAVSIKAPLPSLLCADTIATWADTCGLDGVVWTALPPRDAEQKARRPGIDEAVAYLQGLGPEQRAHAEHYVRHVPPEIRTPYRLGIEARLGWTAV